MTEAPSNVSFPIEALPIELLFSFLEKQTGQELKNSLLVHSKWYSMLRKECRCAPVCQCEPKLDCEIKALKNLIVSDLSLENARFSLAVQKSMLGDSDIRNFPERIRSLRIAREFLLKGQFYKLNGSFRDTFRNYQFLLIALSVSSLSKGRRAKISQQTEISELIEYSILCENIALFRNALSLLPDEVQTVLKKKYLAEIMQKSDASTEFQALARDYIGELCEKNKQKKGQTQLVLARPQCAGVIGVICGDAIYSRKRERKSILKFNEAFETDLLFSCCDFHKAACKEYSKWVSEPLKEAMVSCSQYHIQSFKDGAFQPLLVTLLQGNIRRLQNLIHQQKKRPAVKTLICLTQMCWKLDQSKTESAILDANLRYLFQVISGTKEERLELKKALSLEDILSVLMLGLPHTLDYLASVFKYKNLWSYALNYQQEKSVSSVLRWMSQAPNEKTIVQQFMHSAIKRRTLSGIEYLCQHVDQDMQEMIKAMLLKAFKEDSLLASCLIPTLLDITLLNDTELLEMTFKRSLQVFSVENVHYHLFALEKWIKSKLPFNCETKGQYQHYIERVIATIEGFVEPLKERVEVLLRAEKHDPEIDNTFNQKKNEFFAVWGHVFRLFSSILYPNLVFAMQDAKDNQVMETLLLKVTQLAEQTLRLRKNKVSQTIGKFANNNAEARKIATDYADAVLAFKNEKVMIQVHVIGLLIHCTLEVGLEIACLLEDETMYRQIFKQVLALKAPRLFGLLQEAVLKRSEFSGKYQDLMVDESIGGAIAIMQTPFKRYKALIEVCDALRVFNENPECAAIHERIPYDQRLFILQHQEKRLLTLYLQYPDATTKIEDAINHKIISFAPSNDHSMIQKYKEEKGILGALNYCSAHFKAWLAAGLMREEHQKYIVLLRVLHNGIFNHKEFMLFVEENCSSLLTVLSDDVLNAFLIEAIKKPIQELFLYIDSFIHRQKQMLELASEDCTRIEQYDSNTFRP